MLPTNRGFWKTFLLSIVTLGFYQLYLVHAFAKETNIACTPVDQRKTPGLTMFFLLSLITFGIYGIVWVCNWIGRCNTYLTLNKQPQGLQTSTYLLTVFLLGPLTAGIMILVVGCKMLYLQNKVNETYYSLHCEPQEVFISETVAIPEMA